MISASQMEAKGGDTVLIFSASTGGGHNLAAQTVQRGLSERGYTVQIIDAFADTSKAFNKLLTKGYKQMVEKVPRLYHLLYNDLDKDTLRRRGIFSLVARFMNPDIMPMMVANKPVLLVSTHPFVTNILGRIKDMGAFDIPIISFVTDYKFHGVYTHPKINAYVVGSPYTKKGMVERGVPAEIIHPYGIPVREAFEKEKAPCEAIDKEVKGTVLLMGGSLGTHHMKKAFKALIKSREKIRIIAVCGNNSSLMDELEHYAQKHTNNKLVQAFGFVDNIPALMDESDVIVSKPGGLTTAEAMVKGIPMIIPYCYPGQEEDNAEYLEASGMGICLEKIDELTDLIDYLIDHKLIIQEMAENMNTEAKTYSPNATLDLCEALIADYKKAALQTNQGDSAE
ncbi:MGDG synthase family glycosyltransferase [Pseudoramibacter alactolyticus]|nr:glycosyltransferase [Pseudoramibacter alactolyticus]